MSFKKLSRAFACAMCAVIMMLVMAVDGQASGGGGAGAPPPDTGEVDYPENPPATPMPPTQGELNTYLYDLQVGQQMQYWRKVTDNLVGKFSRRVEDLDNLNTIARTFRFIKDNNIEIDHREAQILCLMMKETDEPPADDVIADFPAWPSCDHIIRTMFGQGAAAFMVNQFEGDATPPHGRLPSFQYWLETAGIRATHTSDTIRGQAGRPGAQIFEDAETEGMECYEPGANIRNYAVTGCGILCTVTKIITGLLNSASEALVRATVENPDFKNAIVAVMILYVTIYGAMVLLGLVDVALGDAVVRIAKLGAVAMLVGSSTVFLFFDMIRCFFIEGTTYLISAVTAVGLEAVISLGAGTGVDITVPVVSTGGLDICGSSADTSGGPLVVLEALLSQVFSPHMFLVIITLFMSSVYGFILGIFLCVGLFGIVMALIAAVTIYLTSLIAQYLLLSLLPYFIAFLLFDRTKYLFDGWIGQIVTYSLSPIFLFAYISLFIVVIEAALAPMLDVTICWAKWFDLPWVFDINKWTFYKADQTGPLSDMPFGFFEVLIFILLVHIMKEFEEGVEELAKTIGGAHGTFSGAVAQSFKGALKDLGGKVKGGAKSQAASGAGKVASKFKRDGGPTHYGNLEGKPTWRDKRERKKEVKKHGGEYNYQVSQEATARNEARDLQFKLDEARARQDAARQAREGLDKPKPKR